MPINVFGNSNSNNSDNKIDTTLFVQKPYLRSSYIESNIEEDIDLKNQFRNKNLLDPVSEREPATKNYIDNKFNDPSIKNSDHVDFNDKDIDNVGWIKVNKIPAFAEHLTPKIYVDNAIEDIKSATINLHELNRNRTDLSSVFNDQDNEFDNNKLTNLDSFTVNKNPSSDNELSSKQYVDDSIGEGQ